MKVKFLPQNIELEIQPNQSVMELAHKNGVKIKSVCNGIPSCAECRVKLVDGEYNVLPPSRKELNLIGTGYFIDQRRLSCQLLCFGDITVDLSEQIEKEKAVRRPQGSMRKEVTEESNAIVGNLIEQEGDIVRAINADREERGRARTPDTEEGDGPDDAPLEAGAGGPPAEGPSREGGGGRRRRRGRRRR